MSPCSVDRITYDCGDDICKVVSLKLCRGSINQSVAFICRYNDNENDNFYSRRATFPTVVYEISKYNVDDRPTTDLSFRKFQMAISQRRIIRSTSCLVIGCGFRGRRIEWRYFRFDHNQDGRRLRKLKWVI